jgi:hypothetical protein
MRVERRWRMGNANSGPHALDMDQIIRDHPCMEEMFRAGATYEQVMAATGLTRHAIRRSKSMLGLARRPKPRPQATLMQRIAAMPRARGTAGQRWRSYMCRMGEAYGHDVWLDITYWACVAYSIRLYPGVKTVREMLPLLLHDLSAKTMRRESAKKFMHHDRIEYRLW